ncbi:MAG: hypothetical protein FWF00_01740 [Endomicrobia bacterium]|nr:hypothetical protein [Endomicrobiia bacterium]MCL2506397.1 hypothetical protein [Endomicrobiia bacterium]
MKKIYCFIAFATAVILSIAFSACSIDSNYRGNDVRNYGGYQSLEHGNKWGSPTGFSQTR